MSAVAASGYAVSTAMRRACGVFEGAICWFRTRCGWTRARDTLFVGRWGVFGPELYLIGRDVRRLPAAQEHGRPASRSHEPTTLGFAREILAAVMRCPPASRLAWAFAQAKLEPLPPDGFVMSKAEVEAWLDTKLRLQSSQVTP